MKKTIRLTEGDIRRIVRRVLAESIVDTQNEEMLNGLMDYLSKEPTDDIYDTVNGRRRLNTMRKAYNYFEPKGIVHDVWAVHYTGVEAFEDIQQNGFSLGVSNYDDLAYSGMKCEKGGWSFALPVDNEYIGEDLGYGDCGLLIRTDGVRAYHKGDGDDEIIFKESMVKEKIPFAYDEDYECWILLGYGLEGEKIPKGAYYDDELERVVFEDVRPLIEFAISSFSK